MSRFSISAPIGAYHPFLRTCLNSLTEQGIGVELSALNAAQDERTGAELDRIGADIAYRRDGPDAGQTDAILEGWAKTGGDLLGWLNADDALAPGALKAVAAAFEADPDLDVVYGHSIIVDEADRIIGYHWAVEPPSARILHEGIISQPSCFFRRAAHDRVGGLDRDLHYTMDWDFWIRLHRAGAKFGFIDQVLSRVLWAQDTKTGQFNSDRRRELERLIAQNPSWKTRANARLGFALNHVLQSEWTKPIRGLVRRNVAPEIGRIRGLGRNGEVDGEAELPVFHYREGPVTALKLNFARRPEGLSADLVPGGTGAPAWTGDTLTLPLATPLPPGETRALTLRTAPNAPAAFQACELVGG